jgi:flagellar hook-basal body complex protein FliE
VTSPIGGIVPVGIGAVGGVTETTGPQAGAGSDGFAAVLASSFDKIQGLQSNADGLAAQAATGDLKDVHDYIIASTEAKLATEMVVTIKNQAVAAFNEIMRMPI